MPDDLNAAISAAGGVGAGEGATAEPLAIAAGVIRTHAQKMLRTSRFGQNGPRRRRVLKADKARDWNPVMRYQRNLDNLFAAGSLPAMATTVLPAFQSGSSPYFVGVTRLLDLPENHYIMRKGRTYYDFGPRT
jgi:hypothetical protein